MTGIVQEKISVDFCVVGGGISGMFAAVTAARRGVKVCLIHDRPVLGGNASSEIRMWIRGAAMRYPEYREGGLSEELALANCYYNPSMNYPMWDAILYNLVKSEKNITLLLNTSCVGAEEKNRQIKKIFAWQLTSYKYFEVKAKYFADCSGDCILSEFTSAKVRQGREEKSEFNESLAHQNADAKTMGNSCLLQARETIAPVKFVPPPFAKKFTEEDLKLRLGVERRKSWVVSNFWWMEMGGTEDTVRDSEAIRDRLIPAVYGVWDYIKNSGNFDSENWELDFVGFLPGKRESRRYEGDFILSQNDLTEYKKFEDEIAYGGWPMDDHDPRGFETRELPQLAFEDVAPYEIPYRSLYSNTIGNLAFAGRNVSVTHVVLSSTRVMGTCGLMGQAVGEAVALAIKYNTDFRGVGVHIDELQQNLLQDDCYLLHTPYRVSNIILSADICSDADNQAALKNGKERNFADEKNNAVLELHEPLDILFAKKEFVHSLRFVFDSDFKRESFPEDYQDEKHFPARAHIRIREHQVYVPKTLVRDFTVLVKKNGIWTELLQVENNHKRLLMLSVEQEIEGVRFVCNKTWGVDCCNLFSIDCI